MTHASTRATREAPLFTIPNAITCIRLTLIPLILHLSYASRPGGILAAAALFALAALSDWVDGMLARRLNTSTGVGVIFDPLADKVLVLAVLFAFADLDLVPLWLVLLNMFREFLVSAVRYAASRGGQTVGANWMGKTKFVMQVVFIEIVYLHSLLRARGGGLPGGRVLLFWLLVGITAASFGFLATFIRINRRRLPTDPQHG